MLNHLLLHDRIEDLRGRVIHVHARAQRRVVRDLDEIRGETLALRQDVEELALFTRALTTLLVDKGVITHEELAERIVEIDREDGVEDGRISS